MGDARLQSVMGGGSRPRVARIGCVSYLNAKPLIEGVEVPGERTVRYDVPARLLADLESGEVDVALCPVVDFYRSAVPLVIVPVGGIGCEGQTLTVRLFSRVPFAEVSQVHADMDSHTSVVLMRVLLHELFGRQPRVVDFDAYANDETEQAQTLLLIGDKVVTAAPPAALYPHQLDLGEAWHSLTGLPFVFAVWMARRGAALGDLPAQLEAARIANSNRIDAIVQRYAQAHGWGAELARQYLAHYLRFTIGVRELRAIEHFAALAQRLDLLPAAQPLRLHAPSACAE